MTKKTIMTNKKILTIMNKKLIKINSLILLLDKLHMKLKICKKWKIFKKLSNRYILEMSIIFLIISNIN